MPIWVFDKFDKNIIYPVIYNLQILPETLMCGIIILAIILGNQSLVALALSLVFTQLIAQGIGRIIMNIQPDSAVARTSIDPCSVGILSKSWARLAGSNPNLLWHPMAPSIYLSTIGFFTGWGIALQQIYKEEIDSGLIKKSSLVTTLALGVILLALAFAYRIYSGCESFMGATAGTVLGLMFGLLGCIALSYVTDRKATNVWGIPLLKRNRSRK